MKKNIVLLFWLAKILIAKQLGRGVADCCYFESGDLLGSIIVNFPSVMAHMSPNQTIASSSPKCGYQRQVYNWRNQAHVL